MTLDEAKQIIRDDYASEGRWASAAATIEEQTREMDSLEPSTLQDFLICLRRKSLAMSTATTALYCRTGRAWPGLFASSHDPVEWEAYLKENKFL